MKRPWYAGVAQIFPGVVFGLYWRRISGRGVFAGLVTGIAIAVGLILTKRDPYLGLNAGFWALCCNFIVTVAVSLLGPAEDRELDPLSSDRATLVEGAVAS